MGDLHFFNMSTNTFDYKVKASNSGIYCIRVHPDNPNIIFTSSSDGVIRVWEMPGFNLVNTIIVGHHDLWSMVFINNRLLTGDIDGEIRVYDIKDLSNILLKGRLVISNGVFVAQVPESPMFYTNDLNVMEIYRKSDMEKITGKNGEHILGQSNRLSVLRELFGIEDGMPALTDNSLRFAPQIAENAGMNSWPETGNFVQPKI
jgi:WD40 repeat protein